MFQKSIASGWMFALALSVFAAAPALLQASEREEARDLDRRIAEARRQIDEAARKLAELHRQRWAAPDARGDDSPMLGILTNPEMETESRGVKLIGVTPGGGAERAGLRAGDVLVEANGTALNVAGAGTPFEQLRAVMAEVEPGAKVGVRFIRNGETMDAEVETQRRSAFLAELPERMRALEDLVSPEQFQALERLKDLDIPGMLEPMQRHFADFDWRALSRSGRASSGVVLEDIGPELGQYFGVDGGVLVMQVTDPDCALEPGDILLEIGGKPAGRAREARGALAALEEATTVTVKRHGATVRVELEGQPPGAAAP